MVHFWRNKMKVNVIYYFKIGFLIGLALIVFSLFLEWYSFEIRDINGDLVASWDYNIFTGWTTPLSGDLSLNNALRPESPSNQLVVNIMLIGMTVFCGYGILFRDIEQANNIQAYANACLLVLILYYVVIFPIMHLFPQGLYFPFVSIDDEILGFFYYHAVGPGYILQVVSFLLVFPHSIFYIRTIMMFGHQERSPESRTLRLIEKVQEPLNLNKLIAQEELKMKVKSHASDDEVDNMITNFIEEGE